MGCFSFICPECGKGIRSTSFSGEHCKLFLLKEGKVIQEMEGQYNSYGSVFIEGSQRPDVKHKLMESKEWNNPTPEVPYKRFEDAWSRVCRLMSSENSHDNGIAAVHTKCFKSVPTVRSADDPNQGWGEDDELLGNTDDEFDFES